MDLGEDPPFETLTLYDRRPPGRRRPRFPLGRIDPAVRRQEADMRVAAERMSRLFRAAASGAVIVVTQVWAMEWVAFADTAGHPVIGMSHESFDASRRSSRFARVRSHYKDVDRLLVLTQEDADRWVAEGLNNVGFMPNPLPLTPVAPSPRTEKVVASIGRLSHAKGVDLLLDVWAEAAPRQPGWILRIYGSGEHEGVLRQQCTELGLDDSVEWAGGPTMSPRRSRGRRCSCSPRAERAFRSSSSRRWPAGCRVPPSTVLPGCARSSPTVRTGCWPGTATPRTRTSSGAVECPTRVSRDTMGEKARQNVRASPPK